MHVNTITLTITPDELETIGFGVEFCLQDSASKIDREGLELLHEDEINVLRSLISAGYSIWLNAAEGLEGRHCHDVNEFLDYLYREKNSDTEKIG